MKNFSRILICTMVAVCASTAAHAGSITAKSVEFDGSFTFQHTSVSVDFAGDYGVTILNIDGTLGYFATPNIEITGGLVVDHLSIDDESVTGFGLKFGGYYNFTTSGNVVPFVGLALAFVGYRGDGPDDTEVTAPEISGGVRFPFRDVASLNLFGGYRHRSTAYGVNDVSGDDIFLGFGFSLFLRGGFGG